ncbi:unnamed protein product [Coccothraustes coccothraustes]
MTNANPNTKKALRAPPQDSEPSITHIITVCTKATSIEQTVAVAMSKGVGEVMVTLNNIQCFNSFSSASGKRIAECASALRNDTKWQATAAPYHPGEPVPRRIISKDWSHKDGLKYFHQTGTLDKSLCRVLCSSIHIMLDDKDIIRVPGGYMPPPFHNRAIERLLLGDNKSTPFQI